MQALQKIDYPNTRSKLQGDTPINMRAASAALRAYASSPCFANVSEYWIVDDPFCRPIRTQDIEPCNILSSPHVLKKEGYRSAKALLAQRILTNILKFRHSAFDH